MKILYLTLNFPDKSIGDSIYTDLATFLANDGNHIDVFTISNKKKTYISDDRGFFVCFSKAPDYFSNNLFIKALSMIMLPLSIKRSIKKNISSRYYDLVLCDAPPSSLVYVSKWASKKFNAPFYLIQKDFFPENAGDLGVINKHCLIYKYLLKKETKLLRSCDYVGTMSESNSIFLIKNHGIRLNKVEIFPNTISPKISYFSESTNLYQKREGEFVIGAIGNMGKPQHVDFIMQLVHHYNSRDDVKFIIAGRGTELPRIEKKIKEHNLKNVLLIKNPNRTVSDSLTKQCSIGLITLNPCFTIPNFPSRSLSYMKYSIPIIAATDQATDFGYYVENVYKCGLWSNSNILDDAIKNIDCLIANPNLTFKLGISGNKYFLRYLTPKTNADILKTHILEKNDLVFKKIVNSKIAKQISFVHANSFQKHFLTSIGKPFLISFYKKYIESDESGIYGCFSNNELIGFLAFGNENTKLAKKAILSHPFSIGIPLAFKILFSKHFRSHFCSALKDKTKVTDGIYFSSLAVLDEFRKRHIGQDLIMFACRQLNKEYNFAYILTDYVENQGVIDFYQKTGFLKENVYSRKDGREMILMKKRLERNGNDS